MSNSQLNDLWHYDMWLAHMTLKLPLRTCIAKPNCLENFPPMESSKYLRLKDQVRTMWMSASVIFKCRKGELGWGLYFSEEFETYARIYTEKKPAIMGWMARVPSPDICPTGHRYLRSPCCDENLPVYIGGPISLANFDEVDRVICKRFISANEPFKNKLGLYKAPRRKIVGGIEVLWSYNLSARDRESPNFHPESDWQLPMFIITQAACCSQVEERDLLPPSAVAAKKDAQSTKRRKLDGARPLMSAALVTSYRPCTYCGLNLAQSETGKNYINMKRHWALKHAAHLCIEMGVEVDNETKPVSAKSFIKHLDKIDLVFNSLNTHSYKVVPASSFFEITDTLLLPEEATADEKEAVFNKFLAEGKSAFKRYQVVYLKGICIPQKYEDLLKLEKKSNYDDVNWQDDRPSGSNFSLLQFNLTEDEKNAHKLDVKTLFTNVIVGWM
ncbi:hypothetical protein ONE63_011488 [Megalurothrips usitatus]|uniref:Uncharacterized protein n=1 Tax=Megalurothrips usitatus TaxID=439358 RepID=A0AAV7X390_9NEOP|nr:hypothetical protein ONE63_011488 [Megalurothrips usitatus]